MRVVQSRFLRGPNIHRMTPCFVAVIDLGDHRYPALDALPGAAARLQALLPGGRAPTVVDAAEWAQLLAERLAEVLAQLMTETQAAQGSPPLRCDVLRQAPPAPVPPASASASASASALRWRLVCGYEHEAVAAEALHTAVGLVDAVLRQQPFDLEGRRAGLQALAAARAVGPATRALLQAAHDCDIPVLRIDESRPCFALGWGVRKQHHHDGPAEREGPALVPSALWASRSDGRIPVLAVTGTNGKTTTTQLINHVLRAGGARTGMTTTQGIFIDGQCVKTGDCAGFASARRVLTDSTVEVAILETARGGILKRGLAFDRCDVGVVLNISSDHLGLDGVQTLQDLAQVKGLVARCARTAAVLNADDALCVAMRETLAPGCEPVFFSLDPRQPVLVEHLRSGGAAAWLDDEGWLVWQGAGVGTERVGTRLVRAAELPFTWQGRARYNTANALAAVAALRCIGCATATIARALPRFVSDVRGNPLRGNTFDVDGVKLIVDYAHNVAAYRALCAATRAMLAGSARLLGVVTSPGDRRAEDLYETGRVCGEGFDELVVYEQDPRGRDPGSTAQEILRGARSAAPAKPLHAETRIRHALLRGLTAASPGDVLVFTCAGSLDDLVEGVRLRNPAAAERLAREVSA